MNEIIDVMKTNNAVAQHIPTPMLMIVSNIIFLLYDKIGNRTSLFPNVFIISSLPVQDRMMCSLHR